MITVTFLNFKDKLHFSSLKNELEKRLCFNSQILNFPKDPIIKQILIFDDSEDIRKILQGIFSNSGFFPVVSHDEKSMFEAITILCLI